MQSATSVRVRLAYALVSAIVCLLVTIRPGIADEMRTSKAFQGVKANTGTVSLRQQGDRFTLTLSDDFKIPDAPAPHWQIVDTLGNTYLLERLAIKGDRFNRSIEVPDYIPDIAKIQIWCAWAEALLGETTFDTPVSLHSAGHDGHEHSKIHTSKPFEGVKANTGTVSHFKRGGQHILTLSDDFKIPDAPAPHWQIVDSAGKTYLLQRLVTKGDHFNKTITVPAHIPDIAKVQIWCAWAQVLLGETSFDHPIK